MTSISTTRSGGLRLRLPATSANLGPAFDSAAVALDFYLEIDAEVAQEFSIEAKGRDAERCASLEDNLILNVYREVLAENNRIEMPLALHMDNGIPLGMGCGSSAASRLAGIAMAVHFGQLGWTSDQIVAKASALEGHPDNAAACWLGGFVAAAHQGETVYWARVSPPSEWRAIIALQSRPLATSTARAVLPDSYSRPDVVANIQSASLLGLAFAQARGDLLRVAMRDLIHQPYRAPICPLLSRLLPLVGKHGILGAALSGAGPAVLIVVDGPGSIESASTAIFKAAIGLERPELQTCRFETSGASQSVR